jgi:hypothetical protein
MDASAELPDLGGERLGPRTQLLDACGDLVLVLEGGEGSCLAGPGEGIGVVVLVEIVGQWFGKDRIADPETREAVRLGQRACHQQIAMLGNQRGDRVPCESDERLVDEEVGLWMAYEQIGKRAHVEDAAIGEFGFTITTRLVSSGKGRSARSNAKSRSGRSRVSV